MYAQLKGRGVYIGVPTTDCRFSGGDVVVVFERATYDWGVADEISLFEVDEMNEKRTLLSAHLDGARSIATGDVVRIEGLRFE